jgi:alpha-beta hydrolase superfamily lysophospholipase
MNEMNKYETIKFESKDGLIITADLYMVKNPKGFILLCHRSHCNRGEYRETAPKLNQLGFSCLAIDQRSGMNIFGEVNETSTLAKRMKLSTGYLDARQDIEAAVAYTYKLNKQKPIVLFGSSYSASLALLISIGTKMIKAIIAFSPGEFLKGIKISEEIKLLASAKKEIKDINNLFKFTNRSYVDQFKPKVEGFHGSKALWESVHGHETYWDALEIFIKSKIE